MLSERRIKEAENNMRRYREDGLIKEQPFDRNIFNILMRNAEESLSIAKHLSDSKKSDLWTIVISYYAMYYMANAVLYKMGHKVGDRISHKVTADALIVKVREKLKDTLLEEYEEAQRDALAGIKADSLVESFDFERGKRSRVQYETKESEKHAKANTSLQRAIEFLFEMQKLDQ